MKLVAEPIILPDATVEENFILNDRDDTIEQIAE